MQLELEEWNDEMATVQLHQISCVKEATGTDLAHTNPYFKAAFPQLASYFFGYPDTASIVSSVLGLAEAIDYARSDPDNLYVTTATSGDLANSIWPGDGNYNNIQQYQSVAPAKNIPIPAFSINISLWDYDSASFDDLLGSITVYASEIAYGVVSKICFSNVEFSCYYITYEVVA